MIEKIKKLDLKILLFIITVSICFLSLVELSRLIVDSGKYKNKVAAEILALRSEFDWTKMPDAESKYTKMMIDILTAFSYKYDQNYKKSMNKDQKIKYIRFNYRCATILFFGLYDVPIIHKMESSFNPWMDHDYGEIGIGGIKWPTALLAERLLRFMPDNIRRLLYFELKSKKDLYDPITSLKITYALLWWERRSFQGREDWYVSIYHWGGFLSKYWDRGEGKVPVSFTLNGKKYNVIKYYYTFREMKEAYESGKLEPCKEIIEKWQAYFSRIREEEIDFRKTRSIIRSLRKKIKNYEEASNEKDEKLKELKKELKKANKRLRVISKQSRSGKGVKALKKVKWVAKDILKKIKVGDKISIGFIITFILCCFFFIFSVYIYIVGFIYFFRKAFKKKIKEVIYNEASATSNQ